MWYSGCCISMIFDFKLLIIIILISDIHVFINMNDLYIIPTVMFKNDLVNDIEDMLFLKALWFLFLRTKFFPEFCQILIHRFWMYYSLCPHETFLEFWFFLILSQVPQNSVFEILRKQLENQNLKIKLCGDTV